MYGYKNIVKPELLVEEPVEQVLTYPTLYNTTIPREMVVEEKLEKLVELEKIQKHIVEKKLISELLWEQEEPRFVEKKIIRELLNQEVEPRIWEQKQLIREILKEEIEPRQWEQKKLVNEVLNQEVVEPRFWIKKQLLRELLFIEEANKHVEKKVLREILFNQELINVFPVEKKWLLRKVFEQIPTEYVEKKLIREILFNQEVIPTTYPVVEKILREQIYEQPELMTRQFEKLNMTCPLEQTIMPVVFKYPIDLTLPVIEKEILCHQVEGRCIYPTSGYLHMVWKSLAKLQGVMEIEKLPVVFEKVEFHRPTIMMVRGTPVKKIFEFKVKIVPTTGLFEIVENEKVIVSGCVKVAQTKRVYETVLPQFQQLQQQQLYGEELLRGEEIYHELKQLKGIELEEELKTLVKTDLKCQYGEMLWTGKWIPFLEGLIQMKQFAKRRTMGVMLPRRITQLIIDPIMHQEYVEKKILNKMYYNQLVNKHVLPVVYDRRVKKTVVGGVEIVELKGMFVPRIEKIEREILFQQQPYFVQQPGMYTTPKMVVPELFEQQLPLFGEELPVELVLNKLKREYVQYYVEECKRFAEYIVKKTLETTTLLRPIVPTPLPVTLKHLIQKIQYERKYFQYFQHEPIFTAIVQGGEFLQLLKCIVEEIHLIKEESLIRRVKCLLVENLRFYKTLEKDVLINMINVKPHFVQLFKTILEQPEILLPQQRFVQPWTTTVFEQEQQPRFLRNTTVVPELPITMPRFFDLEPRMKMFQEPRLRVFRSPSEYVFNKYL